MRALALLAGLVAVVASAGTIEDSLPDARYRQYGETFIDTIKRVGFNVFKNAANAARLTEKHEELNVLPKSANYALDVQEA